MRQLRNNIAYMIIGGFLLSLVLKNVYFLAVAQGMWSAVPGIEAILNQDSQNLYDIVLIIIGYLFGKEVNQQRVNSLEQEVTTLKNP